MSSFNDAKPSSLDGEPPPASYYGNPMPLDVCTENPDIGHEPERTRRIPAGLGFQPNFASVTMFEPAMDGSTVLTATVKSTVSVPAPMHPRVRSRPAPVSVGPVWQLQQVPPLPDYHPLEATAVLVPHASPMEVSGRVSDVLRERSIEASYDDEKAKVRCLTDEGVDFRVRLYRARGEYSHGIIVEVQRRFGSSISFHQDIQAILDAALGKVPPPPSLSLGRASDNVLPLVSDCEDDDEEFECDGSSSLNMVSNILKHSSYDSVSLAFQTLISLTDPAKMGHSTASKVSQALLKPDSQVGREVLARVEMKKESDDFNLRNLAFAILANAVSSVKGQGMEESIRELLRSILINELRHAEANPRSAHMAARCLEFLLDGGHYTSEEQGVLEKALEVGMARHAGLMRQAQTCLDKIDHASY